MYCGFSEGSAGGGGASKRVAEGSSVTVYVKVDSSDPDAVENTLNVIDSDTGDIIQRISVSSYKVEAVDDYYYHYLKATITVRTGIYVEFPW